MFDKKKKAHRNKKKKIKNYKLVGRGTGNKMKSHPFTDFYRRDAGTKKSNNSKIKN